MNESAIREEGESYTHKCLSGNSYTFETVADLREGVKVDFESSQAKSDQNHARAGSKTIGSILCASNDTVYQKL